MAKLVQSPDLHPASCLLCGCYGDNPDRKYWMDVEKYAEDWGNIYFCDQCFEYMVREVDPTFGTDLSAPPTTSQEVTALRERLKRCEHHFGHIAESLGLDLFSPVGASDVGASQTVAEDDHQSEQDDHGTPEPVERHTGESVELTVVPDREIQPDVVLTEPVDGGNAGYVPHASERPTEPFRGSIGSLPVIASEFGLDPESDKGFSLRDI